jgi:hypothetical protein
MTFKVSASQLKLFALCPRSWYLKHVLHAPDDAGAGGLYLTRGNDFDRLVQLHVRDGVTGDTGAPKLANRQLAEAMRYLPAPGTAQVQFAYDVDAGDFSVRGKPDLRAHHGSWVELGDTKTTSDRGPGVGAAHDRPAYALTDATLAHDEQALLYSWCEFALDPAVRSVAAQWTYVSKADCPKSWLARHRFERAEACEWFESYVRPVVASMKEYAAAEQNALDIPANGDSCRRCFVQRACPGPFEGRNVYGIGRK